MQQATDATHSPAPQLAAPAADSSVRRTVLLAFVIILVALLGVFASRFSVSPRGAASPALLVATQPALAIKLVGLRVWHAQKIAVSRVAAIEILMIF